MSFHARLLRQCCFLDGLVDIPRSAFIGKHINFSSTALLKNSSCHSLLFRFPSRRKVFFAVKRQIKKIVVKKKKGKIFCCWIFDESFTDMKFFWYWVRQGAWRKGKKPFPRFGFDGGFSDLRWGKANNWSKIHDEEFSVYGDVPGNYFVKTRHGMISELWECWAKFCRLMGLGAVEEEASWHCQRTLSHSAPQISYTLEVMTNPCGHLSTRLHDLFNFRLALNVWKTIKRST